MKWSHSALKQVGIRSNMTQFDPARLSKWTKGLGRVQLTKQIRVKSSRAWLKQTGLTNFLVHLHNFFICEGSSCIE